MRPNSGTTDRSLRFAAAVIVAIAALGLEPAPMVLWQWIALGVAAILALTAAVGYCPLYTVLGINTCRNR